MSNPTLHQRTRRALEGPCRIEPQQRLLVGVSGGSDSVALLHLLLELVPKMQLDLHVAHFDHRLRSDSARDLEFVADLARTHQLPLHTGTWDAPTNSEDAARVARFQFLLDTAREQACDAIALGHHMEDRLETLFLRLGRGSGLRGLAGLRWRRPDRVDIIRPLLGCQRAELEEWLYDRDLPYLHDPTNNDMRFARNRVRHVMMPALEELGPGWRRRAQESLEDLGAAWDWMLGQALRIVDDATEKHRLPRITLKELPDLLLRTVLQIWLEDRGVRNLRREHLEEVAGLLCHGRSGQLCLLPGTIRFHIDARYGFLERPPAARLDPDAGRQAAAPDARRPEASEAPRGSDPEAPSAGR